jgi:ATP-binding protein involved in chromosome partitioning
MPGPLPPPIVDATVADVRRAVGALPGVARVEVKLARGPADNEAVALPGIGDIVAVSSTKGGVGKSTVAVNLACALTALGRRVGMLDADIYGPSLPTMLGLSGRPQVAEQTKVFPLERYGLRVMSMGFFLDDTSPVIWRGPLVTGLLRQFLKDVQWGELDVLVVDLPPGTGDAQLTLVQQVPLSGGLVVTTPQAVSVIDVERGIAMFNQVNTPVLGLVENMSVYICPHCGTRDELFGSGGAARLERRFGVPVLGQIPIDPAVRVSGDAGTPIVIDQPEHPVSRIYRSIAERVLERIAAERAPAPRIVG